MKYLHQEFVLTTLRDDTVEDKEEIRNILENCKLNRFDVAIDILLNNMKTHYDRVRIEIVHDTCFDFLVIRKNERYHMRKISFSDLISLNVVDYPASGWKKNPNLERADFMDLS